MDARATPSSRRPATPTAPHAAGAAPGADASHTPLTPGDLRAYEAALLHILPLSPSSLQRALPLFRVRELGRGQYLLRGGEVAYEAGVVVDGLLREHFLMPGGVERTKAFVGAGGITGSLADLISGQRSRAFIVAEEPARLMVAPFAAIRALGDVDPAWRDFNERVMQVLYLQKAEREFELLCLDAEARYAAFAARFPGLEARVAARHVASYLGITPVHLSRLRKRRRAGQRRAITRPASAPHALRGA